MKNAVRRGEVMSVLAAYRRGFWGIALFTAVINLLMLAPALYMLQVYDRVLPSGNRMTLAMLTLMVVGLYLFMGLLEWVRSQVVIRLGAAPPRRWPSQDGGRCPCGGDRDARRRRPAMG